MQDTFQTNHVALFSDKISNIWVRDFIPHILKENKNKVSVAALEKIRQLFGVRLSTETGAHLASTIERLAHDHDLKNATKSSMTVLMEFCGKFSEAFMLKMFSEVFTKINTLDVSLQKAGEGSIILELMKKAVPAMSNFYKVVNDLKDEYEVSYASLVPRAELVTRLRESGILNEAFPDELTSTEEEKDARRLAHFIEHGTKFLSFAEIVEKTSPFPEPLKDIGMEMLKELVIGQTILAIEKLILENRGTMLLSLFRSIKSAAKYIQDEAIEDEEAEDDFYMEELPRVAASPELSRELGEIVSHLLVNLPDQWFAPLTELETLKNAKNIPLGKAFISVLHDESLTQRVNDGIKTILPKMIPGKLRDMGPNFVEFEASVDQIHFAPPRPANEEELIRQIKKDGSEAFMRSIEKIVREYVQSKRSQWSKSINDGFKYISHANLHSTVDFVGAVINAVIDFVIWPIFYVVTFIPYQLFRIVLKFFLARLAKAYYNEFQRDYHENILLNVMDKIFSEIGTKHRAASF